MVPLFVSMVAILVIGESGVGLEMGEVNAGCRMQDAGFGMREGGGEMGKRGARSRFRPLRRSVASYFRTMAAAVQVVSARLPHEIPQVAPDSPRLVHVELRARRNRFRIPECPAAVARIRPEFPHRRHRSRARRAN